MNARLRRVLVGAAGCLLALGGSVHFAPPAAANHTSDCLEYLLFGPPRPPSSPTSPAPCTSEAGQDAQDEENEVQRQLAPPDCNTSAFATHADAGVPGPSGWLIGFGVGTTSCTPDTQIVLSVEAYTTPEGSGGGPRSWSCAPLLTCGNVSGQSLPIIFHTNPLGQTCITGVAAGKTPKAFPPLEIANGGYCF